MVRLPGIEPGLPAPEAGALSPELQAQNNHYNLAAMSIIPKIKNNARVIEGNLGWKFEVRFLGGLNCV